MAGSKTFIDRVAQSGRSPDSHAISEGHAPNIADNNAGMWVNFLVLPPIDISLTVDDYKKSWLRAIAELDSSLCRLLKRSFALEYDGAGYVVGPTADRSHPIAVRLLKI